MTYLITPKGENNNNAVFSLTPRHMCTVLLQVSGQMFLVESSVEESLINITYLVFTAQRSGLYLYTISAKGNTMKKH